VRTFRHAGISILLVFFTALASAQWDICGLSSWLDIQQTEGWNIQALESHDISLTHPGFLSMMPYTVTWYADYRGPLLYRLVSGDFLLTGKLMVSNRDEDDIPGSSFSLGGFMVRNPKTLTNGSGGWVPGQEDYVFLSIGRASNGHPSCPGCPAPHFEVKTTDNSNSTLNISSVNATEVEIRMVVLHPYMLVLYKFPNDSWVVHRRYFRSDLANTVQVGMVTYTDWDKVSTYSMPFHNSHVLNEDLNPDPSTNPGLPFAPDIITQYDYLEYLTAVMPTEWIGLDLTNENQVSNTAILSYFGSIIPDPEATSEHIWLGGHSESWNDQTNWLPALVPDENDTVRINSCVCSEVSCLTLPPGQINVSGINLRVGATLTIPAGSVLDIDGPFHNEGSVIIFGQLILHAGSGNMASNMGTVDCRTGGIVTVQN